MAANVLIRHFPLVTPLADLRVALLMKINSPSVNLHTFVLITVRGHFSQIPNLKLVMKVEMESAADVSARVANMKI